LGGAALATLATIIASQAIITGTFSMTRQAMQLGWLPGVRIRQTSDEEYGQIYVPFVNWTMMAFTIALTVSFASSDRLAGAYGTAVSTTMLLGKVRSRYSAPHAAAYELRILRKNRAFWNAAPLHSTSCEPKTSP
jgi:K+ transporter